MSGFNGQGSSGGGPPGKELLCLCLAMLASLLGTPYLFKLAGPIIRDLVYEAYGSNLIAQATYFASFALSGVVIFAISRMALWYAIAAVTAFGAMRLAGGVAAF